MINDNVDYIVYDDVLQAIFTQKKISFWVPISYFSE